MLPIENKVNNHEGTPGYIYAEELNALTADMNNTLEKTGDLYSSQEPKQVLKAIDEIIKHNFYIDSGTVNNIILARKGTSIGEIETYEDGMTMFFKASNTNSGNVTIKINTLEIKELLLDGQQIPIGTIIGNMSYIVTYDKIDDVFNLHSLTSSISNNNIANETGDNTIKFNVADATEDTHIVSVEQIKTLLSNMLSDGSIDTFTIKSANGLRRIELKDNTLKLMNYNVSEVLVNQFILILSDDGETWITDIIIDETSMIINGNRILLVGEVIYTPVNDDINDTYGLGDLFISDSNTIYRKVDTLDDIGWDGFGNMLELSVVNTGQPILDIFGYDDATFIIKEDGTLWSCGENDHGQLGVGDNLNKNIFTDTGMTNVKEVYVSNHTTLLLKNNGEVWSVGQNSSGQLGLGDVVDRNVFTNTGITSVKCIYGTGDTSFIIKDNGTLWACGNNSHNGKLGFGDSVDRDIFTDTGITGVKQVAGSMGFSLVLKDDGTVLSAGYSYYGGHASNTSRNVFTDTSVTNVKQISCYYEQSILVKNDGSCYVTGRNDNGQLGLGTGGDGTQDNNRFSWTNTNFSNVKQVLAQWQEMYLLKNDGTVWGAGRNISGELGLGHGNLTNSFTMSNMTDAVSIQYGMDGGNLAKKNDGSFWFTGSNYYSVGILDGYTSYRYNEIPEENIAKIIKDDWWSLILKENGSVWGCGDSPDVVGLGSDGDTRTSYEDVGLVTFIITSNLDPADLP